MGPAGDAAILLFNPGVAQTLTLDLSMLPADLLSGATVPQDLLDYPGHTPAPFPPLSASWSVHMREGEMKFAAGFTLGVFAPRVGKTAGCTSDYQRLARSSVLQDCFLECLRDGRCLNVFVEVINGTNATDRQPTLRDGFNASGGPCTEGCGAGSYSNCLKCAPKGTGAPAWSCDVCCAGCQRRHIDGGAYCQCGKPPYPTAGIPWRAKPPPLRCVLLGNVTDRGRACVAGNGIQELKKGTYHG